MQQYRFTAKIQPANGGGACVLFPYDVQKEFGTNGKIPIKATFNGVPYTGTLVRYGHPQHMLPLLKAIREQIGKGPGDPIDVVVWKDDSVRALEVPAPFLARLKREGLLAFFEKLSYTHRKEYCRWITEAKKEETRAKRLDKSIEMLHNGVKTPG
ncbi:MAG: YdeI/OmpD-associated family protein [Acidobacteriaceae bacterium]